VNGWCCLACLSIYYTLFSYRDQVSISDSVQVAFYALKAIVVCLSIYYTAIGLANQV